MTETPEHRPFDIDRDVPDEEAVSEHDAAKQIDQDPEELPNFTDPDAERPGDS